MIGLLHKQGSREWVENNNYYNSMHMLIVDITVDMIYLDFSKAFENVVSSQVINLYLVIVVQYL